MTVPQNYPAPPALWHEPSPRHFDQAIPWWIKLLLIAVLTAISMLWLDAPIARWAHAHPIPDLARGTGGDAGRDLMFLEQFGQWACSVVVILAVAILDPKGRRRALAIAIACLITFLLTHLIKDFAGRSRPFVAPDSLDGHWLWAGPAKGFHGSAWGSFPSAHTTGAFALAASLSWYYPKGRAFFISLATITAAQRILHTAHYLSDVIAGIGIATFTTRLTLQSKLPGRLLALLHPDAQSWWANSPSRGKS